MEELWKFVKTQVQEGEQQEDPQSGTVSLQNLKVMLCAVLQFNHQWMKPVPVEQEEKQKVNPQKIGIHEEGKFLVTDEEINWISKHFVLMHQARQDYLLNNKKKSHLEKIQADVPQSDFRPQTCAKSKKFLEKKNPKDEMGDLTYHDYLIQRGKQYKDKNSQKE